MCGGAWRDSACGTSGEQLCVRVCLERAYVWLAGWYVSTTGQQEASIAIRHLLLVARLAHFALLFVAFVNARIFVPGVASVCKRKSECEYD
jgi:hypothetical protein